MPEYLKQRIQFLFAHSNRILLLKYISILYYRIGCSIYIRLAPWIIPQIKSIYIRNSYITKDWTPWLSDIDFTIVIKDLPADQESYILAKFWKYHKVLHMLFPFIQHVAIFSGNELDNPSNYHRLWFNFILNNTKLVKGEPVLQHYEPLPHELIHTIRIHDWIQFLQWFSQKNMPFIIYKHKFVRFFRRFTNLCPNLPYTDYLKDLISSPGQYSSIIDFASDGFYYVNKIVGSMQGLYCQKSNPADSLAQFVTKQVIPDQLIKSAERISSGLKEYKKSIRGIYCDTGSLCSQFPRIWVIMRHSTDRILWTETIKTARHLGLETLPNIPLHIFDECALEVFLATQRYWGFEYFHLIKHARIIYGEPYFTKIMPPDNNLLFDMAFYTYLLRRTGLRESVFSHSKQQLQEIMANMQRLQIFLEKKLIITTANELIEIPPTLNNEYRPMQSMLENNTFSREELYAIWSSCCRTFENNYEKSRYQ